MKATEARLTEVIRKAPQFTIPIYQRTYSWTERECRQLWEDVLRVGEDERVAVHFLGSVVYVEDGLSNQTDRAPLLVIDGQQRLTTVTILLAALRDAVGDADEPMDGFSKKKIENRYLRDPDEDGDRSFKLLLTQTDRETLKAVVAGRPRPDDSSVTVLRNLELFRGWLEDATDLTIVCRGLSKLIVVEVALNREHDNPQLIFESMNSTGRQLSQADLIRNFVLMGIEPAEQTRLYQDYWRAMELAFGQEAYSDHFDGFMRHFLTFRTGTIPRIDDVYEAFKEYSRRSDVAAGGVEALVRDLNDHARYYCRMIPNVGSLSEPDRNLADAFADLHELRVDTAFPLLLELYGDYDRGRLDVAGFVAAVRMIEAYVFRRVVCAIPTNTLNKTFAGLGRSLRKDRYLESIAAALLSQRTYRRFPTDEEFVRALRTRDMYNMRQRSFWLRRFENHGRKERVALEDYTIEHIMPQNENLPQGWIEDLGPEWGRVHETWLHTLGNLTLTGYNSEYRDHPFATKRDMEGGFASSPLRLNRHLGRTAVWNEEAIEARAARLAEHALKVWAAPMLSEEVLNAYREGPATTGDRSLADHPQLASGPTRSLFDALRRELLALDASVRVEVLKLYVAFKAETNFVDVIPQSQSLVVMLNMRFSDVVDPRGRCRDVGEIGRWGNGEVETRLERLEDLPYVVGLARQALELQIGGGEEMQGGGPDLPSDDERG
jgi:uncharacterized protein with ParB-like and HNH nuclease domain/predicted transport protein